MNMEAWPPSVTLTGDHVSLVELSLSHEQDLAEAASDGELHSLWYTMIPESDEVKAEIERRLALRNSGSMLPFSIIDCASDKVVGMTTYMNIDQANRRIEIGSTWYRKAVQRSALNTECKLLLLRHAFGHHERQLCAHPATTIATAATVTATAGATTLVWRLQRRVGPLLRLDLC